MVFKFTPFMLLSADNSKTGLTNLNAYVQICAVLLLLGQH